MHKQIIDPFFLYALSNLTIKKKQKKNKQNKIVKKCIQILLR